MNKARQVFRVVPSDFLRLNGGGRFGDESMYPIVFNNLIGSAGEI